MRPIPTDVKDLIKHYGNIEVLREGGITFYYCPIKDCNDHFFDYKSLKKHVKELHPIILSQMSLDLIFEEDQS